jgi:lipopolysaccharide export system protein LptA
MNSKHVLITGLACVVAAILFFVTMLAAPAPKSTGNGGGGSDMLALDWNKTGLNTNNTAAPNMQQLEIHFTDDHGVAYDLLGDSLTPKSQGIIDVTKPIARIHLKPNRTVIQIEADQGTFVTPTSETRSGMIGSVGQPTSGFLKGNVKIRLFENDGTTPIQLKADSVNQVLTLTMQQANFDRDLGQIEADGLVQLNGRDADFEGENLNIIYSPLLQRINRLEIQHGKFIRIKNVKDPQKSNTSKASTGTESTPTDDASKPAPRPAQFYHITLNDKVAIEAQRSKLTGNELELFVGFEGKAAKQDESAKPSTPDASEQTPTTQPLAVTPQIPENNPEDDVLITWTGSLLMLPLDEKPAMLANAHDAYLQLVGTPMQITPPGMDLITASSIDYLLSESRLRIRSNDTFPLLIDSPQLGGLITAKNYEMYLDKGLGILQGAGELRGMNRSLITDATASQTQPSQPEPKNPKSLTPGTSIHWDDRVELVFYPQASKDNKPSKRADFNAVQTITFRGDVNVQHDLFDVQSDLVTIRMTNPEDGTHKQQASAIEAAGKVAIRTHSTDPEKQLALHAQEAQIKFTADAKGKMQPSQLVASDDVVIRRPLQVLWSDKLTVDLGTGKPLPVVIKPGMPNDVLLTEEHKEPVDALDTMLAWEDKEQPVPTVTAIESAADINPVVDTTDKQPMSLEEDKLYVQRVTVEGDVRARLINNGQAVFAFAHRITGDDDQVELFGNDQRPAQVVQDEGILAGDHLVLTPADLNLHVVGKGSLSYLSHPLDEKLQPSTDATHNIIKPTATTDEHSVSELAVDENAKPQVTESTHAPTTNTVAEQPSDTAPALPSLEPARVRVLWQDNMHYNHQTREARFLGNVILTATRTNAATTVKGDDITVLFNKFIRADQPATTLDDAAMPKFNQDGMVSTQSLSGGRQVRMVNIKGNAEFLEETWAPGSTSQNSEKQDDTKDNRTLLTRLRLAGETMVFDAVPETITIPGPGTLLHEDHRPRPSRTNATSKGDVQFTGKGQTLFRWQDEFLLDIAHNDMIMKDYVQMLHIPEDSENGIQLDCRTFLADMQATGGLGTWLSGKAPTPDLKVVQASRDVRITAQNRQITTDRATYIHDVRKVKLQADENHLTRITTPSGTSSPGAQLIIWELDTNRFYIANPGRMNEVAPKRNR